MDKVPHFTESYYKKGYLIKTFRMKYGIVEIPEKGRGLVATEDLKEDEVLFEESPICSAQMSWGVKLNYKEKWFDFF